MIKLPLSPLGSKIAELIGAEAAVELFQKMAGDRVYMSRAPSQKTRSYQRLVESIGFKHAELLRKWCVGTVLEIPREAEAVRLVRNIRIIHDYSNGMAPSDLCRKYKLARRMIFYILKSPIEIDMERSK